MTLLAGQNDRRRSSQTTPSSNVLLGYTRISHPFHPLVGKSLEVLRRQRVAGTETLTLRHPAQGALTVPREWTDLADPDPLFRPGQPLPRLDPELLLELAALLRQLRSAEHTGRS
jgi:hypothetical protein